MSRDAKVTTLMQNLSDYQEEQIKVLGKLSESFSESLAISNSIKSNTEKLNNAINSMIDKTGGILRGTTEAAEEFNKSMIDAVAEVRKREQAERELQKEKKDNEEKSHNTRMRLLTEFFNRATQILNSLAKSADQYSAITNNLITITGSGASATSVRKEIVHDVVTTLNSETGAYFNAQKSYEELVNIYKSSNVGNQEAMKELARPMLLVQESLSGGTNELATMFNKFYTRYSFSSREMESVVDEIRSNTADNNAGAEASARNMASLSSWMEFYAKGDTDKLNEMMKSISRGTAWLESMNIDSTRYTDYINKIASGEANSDKQLVQILHSMGLTGLEAQNMFESGDIEELYNVLFQGEHNIMENLVNQDVRLLSQSMDALNMDRSMLDTYNAFNSENYESLEDFIEDTDRTRAVETIENKYVSATDKTTNILSGIAETLTTFQEKYGIGLSDILSAAGIIIGIIGSGKILNFIGSKLPGVGGISIGSIGTSASAGGSILSTLGTSVLPKLATAAPPLIGALGAAYGIGSGVKDLKEGNRLMGLTEIGGGAAMGVGGAMLAFGAANGWNPVGWAAMIAGGITLLGTTIYKSAEGLDGTAEAIRAQYDEAIEEFNKTSVEQVATLADISAHLNDSEDIQEQTNKLLNTGLLTEKDKQEALNAARDNDIEALKKLTDAYLEAQKDFMPESSRELIKAQNEEMKYYEDMKSDMNQYFEDMILKDLNGELSKEEKDEFLGNFTNFAAASLNDFNNRIANGEELTKDEEKYYELLKKSLEDADIDWNEFHKLQNQGTFWKDGNTYTRSAISKYTLESQAALLGIETGPRPLNSDEVKDIESILEVVEAHINQNERDEAIEELYKLKNAGYTSKDTEDRLGSDRIAEYCEKLDIPAFAKGTNYISSTQLALLHKGEAVVPEHYNPAANPSELDMLRRYYSEHQQESNQETAATMQEFIAILTEIKEFLVTWKSDNNRREDTKNRMNRMYNVSDVVTRYMPNY